MIQDVKKTIKVVVGMSGGVDSSLTAALLVEQGCEVTGVFLECWRAPGCRTEEDRKDALDVALKLKIPFTVLDFKDEYRQKVVDYFYREYEAGRTPNPDVMCNREIKFGMFYEWAMKNGFDAVATGHYARISEEPGARIQEPELVLKRGVDENKDQSYFLYQLRAEQLPHILFPLGEMTKDEVRQKAKERDLTVADKPDSQGICFIGEISTEQFLKDLGMEEKKGEVIIERNGEELVVGEQKGAWFYTVGQRIGLRAPDSEALKQAGYDPANLPPFYVVEKDVQNNRLIVSEREELYAEEFRVGDLHWIRQSNKQKAVGSKGIRVRIRNLGGMIPAELTDEEKEVRADLLQPVFGAAPGQAAVFYQGDVVLGGGVIL